MKYYNDFFITPIEEQPIHDFCISAIHILTKCSANFKKGLRQEYYFLNDRCYLENKKVVLSDSMQPRDFYGKRINVQAIVGVNGSGKSSLLEIIYRVINNLGCLLNRGKRRKSSDALYFIKGLYAEIYYVIDGKLARISCFDNTKANAIAYLSNQLSLNEADIHKEPLTKLRQDTIKQMKEGGVI